MRVPQLGRELSRFCGEARQVSGKTAASKVENRRCDSGFRLAAGFAAGTSHKANGAGIAADPTLTDAWASFPAGHATSRLPLHSGTHLASDVWPIATCLATGAFGFRHRRSHRHPAFAPHSQRVDRAETFSSLTNGSLGRACLPVGWSGQWGISGFRLVPPPVLPGLQPVRCRSFARSSSKPTCKLPKLSACRLSKCAWTVAIAIFKN